MTDLTGLKEFLAVAIGVCSILSSLIAVGGTWILLTYRLRVVEKVLYGNGKPGLIQEVEELKIECARQHGLKSAIRHG